MKKIITLIALLSAMLTFAQPGSLDTSFSPGANSAGISVNSIAIQSDGKIIIGGGFQYIKGTYRRNLARMNKDGSIDKDFYHSSLYDGADGVVHSVVVQPDGKILFGGQFSHYNGAPCKFISRLNSDGTRDTGFNAGAILNNFITSIALQSDGKILIGGNFVSYNGIPRHNLARLNSDGSLDTGFNPGTGPGGLATESSPEINSIAVQTDGKILIGGYFTSYDGIGRNRIARLNSDGSLDMSFNPGTGANDMVKTIVLQSDGKILIGGRFTNYNNVLMNAIARLNPDGSLDTEFGTGVGLSPANSYITSIAIQSDNKILIGGYFTSCDGIPQKDITRLNADGSYDTAFNSGTGTNYVVNTIALQSDGKILIGGQFTQYDNTEIDFVARINDTSSLGIAENTFAKSIQSYPNPVSDILTIDSQENISSAVEIYDTLGKCVKTTTSFDNRIDVSSLSSGIYILKATDENNAVYRSKFVKN